MKVDEIISKCIENIKIKEKYEIICGRFLKKTKTRKKDVEWVLTVSQSDLSNECCRNPRKEKRCWCCTHWVPDFDCDLVKENYEY